MTRTAVVPRTLAILGGLAACSVTVSAPVAQAGAEPPGIAAACELTELPTPDGTHAATVDGASPDGLTLTGYATTGVDPAEGAAMIWRDGAIAATIDEAPSAMLDLNSSGAGTGTSRDGTGKDRSWVYENGGIRQLDGEGAAAAIGESGQVVGSRLEPTPNGPPIAVPVVWPAGGQGMVDLPRDGQTGKAMDVSADGTIVGVLGTDAYVWHPDGTHGPLPRPGDTPPEEATTAARISGPWVIGTARGSVRWNLATGEVERLAQLEYSVNAVNDRGWALGEAYTAGPVAVLDGETVQLPPHPRLRAHTPVSISTDGKTFGGVAYDRPPLSERPVRWTCP